MTAPAEHIATLERMLERAREWDTTTVNAAALTAAIAALRAQQEPVAHRWLRDGVPVTKDWCDGLPSERAFAAAEECAPVATWTVQYAYAAPPATPEPKR